jgi:hypothetical protein
VKVFPQSITLALASFFIFFIGFDYIFISSLGLSFSLYLFLEFTKRLGKELPLIEFLTLIASFQWIVGAKIGYNIGKTHYKYYMYVEEDLYMTYVVPGVVLFYLGLNLFRTDLKIKSAIDFLRNNFEASIAIARTLLIIGLLSFFISKNVNVPAAAFILYLANLILYVAVIHFIVLFPKRKWLIFLGSLSFFFFFSLDSGLFHDLIITASFLLFFMFSEKTSLSLKFSLLLLGFSAMYVIQLVKSDYRQIIWDSAKGVSPIEAFYNVVKEEFAPANPVVYTVKMNKNEELEEQTNINTRLNQGWIISKIMENVPKNQEYLKGKTITESIEAAILPRFLFPNKKGANDALVNFRMITGIDITRGTSMGLSTIGEFYANYGQYGGWISMLIYGSFLALFIRLIKYTVANDSPLILFWLVLFFFQVVKAETDFIKIFNHLIKSFLFFLAFLFIGSVFGFDLLLKERLESEAE